MSKGRLALVVGGGPAPGINGVISAVTIEALTQQGWEVLGVMEGFKHLVKGSTEHIRNLTVDDVKNINLKGGSILSTARVNPTKNPHDLQAVLGVFKQLAVNYLVTIGGDDTAFSGSTVYQAAGGSIRVAHVPKTIDNDLPLPPSVPTFGFETARQVGVGLVRNLAEDTKTSKRWFFVVSMGRAAGHLALGIGKAAAATLTIIPEEFRKGPPTLDSLCDILLGAIIKRRSKGQDYGVAVLAEGLIEAIGEKGLGALQEGQLSRYGKIERDPHGNLRMGEVDFGRMIKDQMASRLKALDIDMTLTEKEIGYELRCADPVPFDAEYTRDLGYSAVKFLISDESARYGAIISLVDGKLKPLPFETMLHPVTRRMQTRQVDITGEGYECARRYMIRLDRKDVESAEAISRLAKAGNMDEATFVERFSKIIDT